MQIDEDTYVQENLLKLFFNSEKWSYLLNYGTYISGIFGSNLKK